MFDFLKQGDISLKDVENSVKELPLPQKIKAIAIYKRYKEIRKIEDEMKECTKVIEKSFLKKDAPVLEKISDLVTGKKPIQEEELQDLDKYLNQEEKSKVKEHLEPRKIGGYWFQVLKNAGIVKESIGKDDEPLLKAVQNIYVTDDEGTDNFTIYFDVAENEVISNKQLWKKFFVKNDEPIKCEASEITWKGNNLTVKEIKKKQKNKKTGQQRVVTKTVEAKSFFTFFKSIEEANVKDLEDEAEMEKKQKLENDFEIGGVIVDEVLPYSLEYYLGVEHDEDDDDFGDDDDEESDEEEDRKKKKSKSKGKKQEDGKGLEEKPECKQQ